MDGPGPVLLSLESKRDTLTVLLLGVCAEQRRQIESLNREKADLEEANRALSIELEELKRQQGLNSKNSSKPPSSDGVKRERRTARSPERECQKRRGRRPGKQKGAQGSGLTPTDKAERMVLLPSHCGKCGDELGENAEEVGVEKRQVWDLPEPRELEKIEYQAAVLRCKGCGGVTKAEFGRWATGPVSYGPRMHAMVSYLAVYQHLPYERMREHLRDVYGAEVSSGALVQMVSRCGEMVQPSIEEIRKQLQSEAVVHFDETVVHLSGKTKWVHGAATESLTLLGRPCRRGKEGIEELGVAEKFTGIAIHDNLAVYRGKWLENAEGHGLCNAHHLRELLAVSELDKQRWSEPMSELLLKGLDLKNAALEKGEIELDGEVIEKIEERYDEVIRAGWTENQWWKGRRKKTKAANLLQRLEEHKGEVLRFLHDFGVPFSNNQIERDLRPTKLHEKISGGWRSEAGARAFLSIRSYLSTARKQGRGMLTAAFESRPWMPSTGGP
jgi:transposase